MEQVDETLFDYDQVHALVDEHGWRVSASELHGYLAGLVALGLFGSDTPDSAGWFEKFLHDYPAAKAKELGLNDKKLLHQLWLYTTRGYESDSFEFDLLVPDDDASLIFRVESLALWCSGFLSGIQTALTLVDAGVRGRIQESEQVRELLVDLGAIRQAENLELNDVDDLLETERNYAEISEYVRVAAMNIYMEVVLGILDEAQSDSSTH